MQLGLETLLCQPELSKTWKQCALLCNQASVDKKLRHSIDLLQELLGENLVALFGPQHGLISTVQDNMKETEHSKHSSGIPIYSLYSETREPTLEMLNKIDTLIIDLQIVGCRVYTFKATIKACLTAAKKFSKKVVVLDRPNPLGGLFVEGRCIDANYHSFVAPDMIPMQHGMTAAECAQFFNRSISADLEVVTLKDWSPDMQWDSLKREWILTSPNLPTWDSVSIYPGLVLLEGTNISEGRGTTLPFQMVGANYIKDENALVEKILSQDPKKFPEVCLRPTSFMPVFGKDAGKVCKGFQIHIRNTKKMRSFALCTSIISTIREEYPNDFAWSTPPYEYEYEKKPIDLLIGREDCETFFDNFSIHDPFWRDGIEKYLKESEEYLLYKRRRSLVS